MIGFGLSGTSTGSDMSTDSYDQILYEVDDPVATITLNRPDALNAWTGSMDGQIRHAIERAEADPGVVGIVITGAGRGFCAGADMNSLDRASSRSAGAEDEADAADTPEQMPAATSTEFYDGTDFGGRFTYLLASSKPILAAINGPVAGMGYPFSLCADIRVGTEKSLFVTAFSERGLIAEWGLSWLLPRLVGPSAGLDLLYSSRRVYGEEAHRLGLLNHLVDPDQLLPFCRSYIENLAAKGSPGSFAVMKRQVYEQFHRGLGQAEAESQRLMMESFHRPDFREGVRSFMEKRPPEFPRIGEGKS